MTVWKDTRVLATKSALAAIALAQRQDARLEHDGEERRQPTNLPAYIIPPVAITKANYKQLFNGYLKKSEVCVGEYKKYC